MFRVFLCVPTPGILNSPHLLFLSTIPSSLTIPSLKGICPSLAPTGWKGGCLKHVQKKRYLCLVVCVCELIFISAVYVLICMNVKFLQPCLEYLSVWMSVSVDRLKPFDKHLHVKVIMINVQQLVAPFCLSFYPLLLFHHPLMSLLPSSLLVSPSLLSHYPSLFCPVQKETHTNMIKIKFSLK